MPISASMFVKDYLRPAAVSAGVVLSKGQRFGLHNLRHSLSTWLVNKGNLRIAICDERIELLLLGNEKSQQGIAIKAVQIRERSAIHGQSMPSIEQEIICKSRMNKGESASSSDCNFRLPSSLNSPPVDAF